MLGLVRDLAHSGALTIVIITHKLKEVAAFVDEVTVLRGTLESRKFSVCYFRDNRMVGMDSVNRPADHLAGRKLLGSGAVLGPEVVLGV